VHSVSANEEFVRLFTRHQQDVYRFVLSLLPQSSDALDVVQETAIALWGKFSEYDPKHPFLPWALSFATLEVYKFRARQQRQHRHVVTLSDAAVMALIEERASMNDRLEARRAALDTCLQKLSVEERRLVDQRYGNQTTVRNVTKQTGAGTYTLYRQLRRIRRKLLDCVSQLIAGGLA
jgi:RNA polymerase sigma-70 factor (ECF subfamily)